MEMGRFFIRCVRISLIPDLTISFLAICYQVLQGFTEKKRERGVDEMLVRLYQPILWRALKVRLVGVRVRFKSRSRKAD